MTDATFKNPKEVYTYLVDAGYRIGQATVYLHVKKRLLVADADGNYPMSAVEAYIRAAQLKKRDGTDPGKDKAIQRKTELEAQKLEEQVRRLQFDNEVKQGLYVLKAQAELDLADRARILRADMLGFFRAHIDDFIILVEGNQQAAPKALEWWEQRLEDWMDRYARKGKISLEDS